MKPALTTQTLFQTRTLWEPVLLIRGRDVRGLPPSAPLGCVERGVLTSEHPGKHALPQTSSAAVQSGLDGVPIYPKNPCRLHA